MIDAQRFREVLGSFPTGVTVVTGCDPRGEPFGLTVNSFTSVSLDPPLVLVCIDHLSTSHDPLLECGSFVVNILSADQTAVASRFAAQPSDGRFLDVAWDQGPLGDPVLPGATAWLACSLADVHTAGDHSILVGRVEGMDASDREPLAFHRGSYARVVS